MPALLKSELEAFVKKRVKPGWIDPLLLAKPSPKAKENLSMLSPSNEENFAVLQLLSKENLATLPLLTTMLLPLGARKSNRKSSRVNYNYDCNYNSKVSKEYKFME